MSLREEAARVAQVLGQVPGVTRVIVAGRDGLPLYDDQSLIERDRAAAAAATALGVAAVVADTLALGPSRGSILLGEDAVVVIRPLESGHALAAVAAAHVDVGDLHRRVRRHARELDGIPPVA